MAYIYSPKIRGWLEQLEYHKVEYNLKQSYIGDLRGIDQCRNARVGIKALTTG